MDIKASDVKTLRDMTGAGMLDCKKALTETKKVLVKQQRNKIELLQKDLLLYILMEIKQLY